jgi:hypothetical protein
MMEASILNATPHHDATDCFLKRSLVYIKAQNVFNWTPATTTSVQTEAHTRKRRFTSKQASSKRVASKE